MRRVMSQCAGLPALNRMTEHRLPITLFGASGHAKVVIDVLERGGYPIELIVDDNAVLHGAEFYSYHIAGGRSVLQSRLDGGEPVHCMVAIGNNRMRAEVSAWLSSIGAVLAPAAIHPSAQISRSAEIGNGSVVMAGCVLNPDVVVGSNVIINTVATIDHDCVIADAAHVAPGATLCGNVVVGECSLIGAGAVVHPNIKIGNNVIVGAGATVLQDVPDNITVVGTPARRIR